MIRRCNNLMRQLNLQFLFLVVSVICVVLSLPNELVLWVWVITSAAWLIIRLTNRNCRYSERVLRVISIVSFVRVMTLPPIVL